MDSFRLDEITIAQLQTAMEMGEETARTITAAYLEQIAAIDEATVNAVLAVNPDVLTIADALDAERQAGQVRSPLHGIPILIKGNIDTADKMTTTAGSLALAGSIAPRDAFIVERLREAGAIILGKANLSEWANFRSTRSSSGWSAEGGQTRNPYALDRTPSGSSSGSGAGVAANLCVAAIGTETDGSIVSPASINGIVGIKPTLGAVSRSGIIPIAHSQDTAGPMARTVRDAAILLGALTGFDERDPLTQESEGKAFRDYTQYLDEDGLRGARIGVVRAFFGRNPHLITQIETAIEVIKSAGATIIDPVEIKSLGKFDQTEYDVLLYEFKADLNAYLATLGDDASVKTMADVIAFNVRHRDKEMVYFDQEHTERAQAKGDLSDPEYIEALANNHRQSREEGIDAVIAEHNLDALIAPTGGPAWLIDYVNGDHYTQSSSSLAAVAGYPHITVPAGFVWGLPIGLSFMGGAYSEPTLLRLAYAFEQLTKHRKPPDFRPSVVFA